MDLRNAAGYDVQQNKLGALYISGCSLAATQPLVVYQCILLFVRGYSYAEISRHVKHYPNTVQRHVESFLALKTAGEIRLRNGRPCDVFGLAGRQFLLDCVQRWRSHSLELYTELLSAYLLVNLHPSTVSKQLAYLGLPRTKLTVVYSESLTDKIISGIAAHVQFFKREMAADADFLDDVTYVDVCGPEHGRSGAGEPAMEAAPSSRGRHFDLILAINRKRGVIAKWVVEGHVNYLTTSSS